MKHTLNILNYRILISVFSIFLSTITQAEVFRWAHGCEKGMLEITNSSATEQSFWLQKWGPELLHEEHYSVKGKSQLTLPTEKDQDLSILVLDNTKKWNKDYKINLTCLNEKWPATPWQGDDYQFDVQKNDDLELQFKNLIGKTNVLTITETDSLGKITNNLNLQLKERERFIFYLKPQKNTAHIRIKSEENILAYAKQKQNWLVPHLVYPQKGQPEIAKNYFLIAPRSGSGDSFVAEISDPRLLQKAQDLILHPEKNEKILFAEIQLGSQKINRNFGSVALGFWSWSVKNVTNISDIGSTSCNGMPQMLEDRSEFWSENPGRICFWNYRIKKQLSAEEIRTGFLNP